MDFMNNFEFAVNNACFAVVNGFSADKFAENYFAVKPAELSVGKVVLDFGTEKSYDDLKNDTVDVEFENKSQCKVAKYLTFFKNNSVSAQSWEVQGRDVLYSIPLTIRQSLEENVRLLICYRNGCVNILSPKNILTDKLHVEGGIYKNAYASENDIVNILLAKEDDILVVRSKRHYDHAEALKAVPLKNFRVHKGTSMNTKGNKIVDSRIAECVDFKIVNGSEYSKVEQICMKSKNYNEGCIVEKCAEVDSFVKSIAA